MRSEKSLSIIIANFNKGNYISETFDSILFQTLLPNEIIVIDDNSTDNSREIISKYKNKFPDLFNIVMLETNMGVQYCKNLGIDISKSNYLCFVDSDDIFLDKRCLELQMRLASPKSLVGVYQLPINDIGVIIGKKKSDKEKKAFKKHVLYNLYKMDDFMFWPWHYIAFKKTIIALGKFNNPYSLYEDSEMIIRLAIHRVKIRWINIEGKGYRVSSIDNNHLSHSTPKMHAISKQYIWSLYRHQLPISDKFYSFYLRVKKWFIRRKNSL